MEDLANDDDLTTLLPTREEIERDYPPLWTWLQLKQFIRAGDLAPLKRHPGLMKRYAAWKIAVSAKYGSLSTYVTDVRLDWGDVSTIPQDEYFGVGTERHLWKVLANDWPYAVPFDVEHHIIWTRVPMVNEDLVPEALRQDVERSGIWGFSGGANMDPALQAFVGPSAAHRDAVRIVGARTNAFVQQYWREEDWETAWFINPPRLQSVKGLAHAHVFARRKEKELQ
ncbi:hypothetical protein EXIGLDRAFT_618136 [Exidia glandulosa HHB12029]|uniref:Uncharacterized protein n=1 Tax=Exidia glandulosa HHB12029 TaxID=1314781 RepID=A0A165FSY9_EXIGL|nr:hypothetical protein EXIGLDRAFT_618136 [Exidia glandulosa HHB12029]